jgi:hypothetical protein
VYSDETLRIFVQLKLPKIDKSTFKSFVSRLGLSIEVHATSRFSSSAKPGEPPQREVSQKELIFSKSIDSHVEPEYVAREKINGEQHFTVFWEILAPLSENISFTSLGQANMTAGRPKTRIQNPSITISVSGLLQPAKSTFSTDGDTYLPSQTPLHANVLQPFLYDPHLPKSGPFLSATKLSRVSPLEDDSVGYVIPLRSSAQKSFWAVAAVMTMVRLSRLHIYGERPTITASLDVEISALIENDVTINRIELQLVEGTITMLSPETSLKLPMKCQPGNKVTSLHQAVPEGFIETSSYHKSNIRTLNLVVSASVHVAPKCLPELVMSWSTSVDFSTPLDPSFSDASRPHIQRLQRPILSPNASSPMLTSQGSTIGSVPLMIGADTLPSPVNNTHRDNPIQQRPRSYSGNDTGLTITFSGPENVIVGEVFQWTAFVVNHSSRARRLGLLVIPKRRKMESRKALQRPLTTKGGGAGPGNGLENMQREMMCPAVMDEFNIFTSQRNAALEPAELVSLTTDVMIG